MGQGRRTAIALGMGAAATISVSVLFHEEIRLAWILRKLDPDPARLDGFLRSNREAVPWSRLERRFRSRAFEEQGYFCAEGKLLCNYRHEPYYGGLGPPPTPSMEAFVFEKDGERFVSLRAGGEICLYHHPELDALTANTTHRFLLKRDRGDPRCGRVHGIRQGERLVWVPPERWDPISPLADPP